MSIKLLKISVFYLLIGVLMGMFMSISKDFTIVSVHVHTLLLGFTVLGFVGILYHIFPDLEQNIMAKIHFWLHNIGLPIMIIFLIPVSYKQFQYEPGIAIGSIAVAIGIILFVINVFKNLKSSGK